MLHIISNRPEPISSPDRKSRAIFCIYTLCAKLSICRLYYSFSGRWLRRSVLTTNSSEHCRCSAWSIKGDVNLDESSSDNRLPAKCQECVKSSKPFIHSRCTFCQDLGFQEETLCHLNRCIHNSASFECYAFQPLLKLVEPSGQKVPPQPRAKFAEGGFEQPFCYWGWWICWITMVSVLSDRNR